MLLSYGFWRCLYHSTRLRARFQVSAHDENPFLVTRIKGNVSKVSYIFIAEEYSVAVMFEKLFKVISWIRLIVDELGLLLVVNKQEYANVAEQT